jgi:hypothetical protein
MTPKSKAKATAGMVAAYRAGFTIRDVCETWGGLSTCTVYNRLINSGVQMRSAGTRLGEPATVLREHYQRVAEEELADAKGGPLPGFPGGDTGERRGLRGATTNGRRPLPRVKPGQVMHRLYMQGWTLLGLVDLYDISLGTLRRMLAAEGCVFRPPLRRTLRATPGMIDAYTKGFLSARQISRLWGPSYNRIRRMLTKAGVQLRARGVAPPTQPTAQVEKYGSIAARERSKLGWS